MFIKIEPTREGVLAFDVIGKLTDKDYKKVLIPAIEDYLKTSEKAHLLLRFGPDFEGYTMQAMKDDALLGLRHLHDFERIAIVTDHRWITQGMRMFGPLMSSQLKIFDLEDTDRALTWVAW